jgi:hypothetical protein
MALEISDFELPALPPPTDLPATVEAAEALIEGVEPSIVNIVGTIHLKAAPNAMNALWAGPGVAREMLRWFVGKRLTFYFGTVIVSFGNEVKITSVGSKGYCALMASICQLFQLFEEAGIMMHPANNDVISIYNVVSCVYFNKWLSLRRLGDACMQRDPRHSMWNTYPRFHGTRLNFSFTYNKKRKKNKLLVFGNGKLVAPCSISPEVVRVLIKYLARVLVPFAIEPGSEKWTPSAGQRRGRLPQEFMIEDPDDIEEAEPPPKNVRL